MCLTKNPRGTRSEATATMASRGLSKAGASRRSLYVALKGLPLFSNRDDVSEFVAKTLGGHPSFADGGHRIYPSLDHKLMPSGNWLLQLTDAQVAAGAFELMRSSGPLNKVGSKSVIVQGIGAKEATAAIDSLTVRVSTASRATAQAFGTAAEIAAAERAVSSAYNQPRTARKLTSSSSPSSNGNGDGDSQEAASHPTEPLMLDDRVVRLVNTPLRFGVDEVGYLLREYRLAAGDGRPALGALVSPPVGADALVAAFETPFEARRAVREISQSYGGSKQLRLVQYK